MRIVCPQCQAAYKVNLPDLDESGMEVKCAKCQNIFPVKKEDATPQDSAASPQANAPPAKDLAPASEDQDDSKEIPLSEEYLEDMMDEVAQQEAAQETPAQPPESKSPEASQNPGSLIDANIQEEPDAQKAENPSQKIPFTEQEISEKSDSLEDLVLDDMWEKAVHARSRKSAEDSSSDSEQGQSEGLAHQKETKSRWQQAQDQDKAMAEKDLQLAEEHERSLDEQWSRALAVQESSKSSLEDALEKDLKDSSLSEKNPPAQPAKAKTVAPQTSAAVTAAVTAAATGAAEIKTDDSFDDDWMRALATQATTKSEPAPAKIKTEPVTDSAPPAELTSESKTEAPPPSVAATPEPEPIDRPAEPAIGAVMESTDEFNTDELWEQAFTEPEAPEPAAEQDLQTPDQAVEKKDDDPRPAPIIFGQDRGDKLFDSEEALKNYDESAYADDDDDLFDYQPKKRSRGPLGIPSGKKGDWIIAGFVVSLLLIVAGVYFAVETFAPKELTDIQVADTVVPEGLTPNENSAEFSAEDPSATGSPAATQPDSARLDATTSFADTAGSSSLEAGGRDQTLISELAKSKILGDSEQNRFADTSGFNDVLASGSNSVTMSTIMPVAYNSTDIRVLSFSLELQMSDAASARRVRAALPIYEKIMIQTVEEFLKRKFYDDVLYVREKLQKRLLVAMNKSIQGGRVKKTKFTDFAIQ